MRRERCVPIDAARLRTGRIGCAEHEKDQQNRSQRHLLLRQIQSVPLQPAFALTARQAYHKHAYISHAARRGGCVIAGKVPADRSVGFLITDVAHLLRRDFNRRTQTLGLSQSQWRVLVHLKRDEGCSQAALAERLEIQPITLTRLLDRMQAAGWIERRADPRDRRVMRLHLTPQAEPVLAEIQQRAQSMLDEALAGLSAERREALVEALCTMKINLSGARNAVAGGAG
ncbi:MAG: MarR family transcriptional regulator [Gammaproteobacteria bacterium]|nr:MarR family transcriptional regulator [Gammaproteobacteria bacterium]